jgi:glycosyltransferase involved in cell wall biosynthesis
MKICFVGLDNLPILAREYRSELVGGESVQQTLLARALARRGYDVSMVVADYGQADGATWDGIRTFKAYGFDAGVPVLRFLHPRGTGLWGALLRADADLYYLSCAGAQVGQAAMFCARHRRRLVFRAASDADCDPARLLIRYARDRWLYGYGLRRANAILVQSTAQAHALARGYALAGRVAGMLVEHAPPAARRDIDLLWVSNIRQLKRPDRALRLASQLPELAMHMAGGPLRGEQALYRAVEHAARAHPNLTFHGRLPYAEASDLYGRARLLVNTSDVEGFPNSYLQAWVRGTPVVTLIDPDRVIEREGLGVTARAAQGLHAAVDVMLRQPALWQAASERCLAYMAREHGEDRILAPYLDAFERAMRGGTPATGDLLHA